MIFKKISVALVSLVLAISFNANAGLITIDFQSLETNNASTNYQGGFYNEKGFQLLNLSANNLASFGTLEKRYTGSTALFNDKVNGIIELSKIGGGTFDLLSIDLAELNGDNAARVTFTRDGGYSQTFNLDAISFKAESFLFDVGFLGSTTVTWLQTAGYHQFDNIIINDNLKVAKVPEPSTLAIFALALMGLASRRCKKQ